MNYGWGEDSRSEVITAYCMNMASVLESNNDTRLYHGGELEITQNDGNGGLHTWKMGLVGGRLSTDSSNVMKPVCLYLDGDPFEFSNTNWRYQIKAAEINNYTANPYIDSYDGNHTMVTVLNETDAVDFCDQNEDEAHAGKTRFHLTHFWDGIMFDVTSTVEPFREARPMGILKASDKSYYHGVLVSLGAAEEKMANLKLANSTAITFTHNMRLLNQRHDPKFDPYCDDLNNNGYCDCFVGSSNTLRDNPSACTLADTAAEPTISNPPYWPNSPNANDYESFFAQYGNKWGAELVDSEVPPNPLSHTYFFDNEIFMNFDEILICKYLKTGETTHRRPSQIVWDEFSNLHHAGCPDAAGNITATTTWNEHIPEDGGGPVRVINPKTMKNAYDIEKPNTYLTLMAYALKGQAQGVTLSNTAKVFTFDEALALVSARRLMPARNLTIRTEADTVIQGAYSKFEPVRISNDQDVSALSAILKGITKPTLLAQPD